MAGEPLEGRIEYLESRVLELDDNQDMQLVSEALLHIYSLLGALIEVSELEGEPDAEHRLDRLAALAHLLS